MPTFDIETEEITVFDTGDTYIFRTYPVMRKHRALHDIRIMKDKKSKKKVIEQDAVELKIGCE
jgi:hypothetical protein